MNVVFSGAAALRALSLAMGVFLLFMGTSKLAWFLDSGLLAAELQGWRGSAPAISRAYLDLLQPGVPVFARLVVLGELAAGVALVAGFRVRLAALMALVMILNFHFASGIVFTVGYFTNGYGPPVVGSLLALSLGGRNLPFSLTR